MAYLTVSDDAAQESSCSQHHLISSIRQGAHIAGETGRRVTDVLSEEAVCGQHLGPENGDDKATQDNGHQECASDREVDEA